MRAGGRKLRFFGHASVLGSSLDSEAGSNTAETRIE